jgi:hypothetical protein
VNAPSKRTVGITRNGIGLNGRWRLKGVGVRGEMKACRGSGPRPLGC